MGRAKVTERLKVSPWKKAANTDRWTEILFRALSNRVAKRWRFISFRGTGGGEWRGVVDVLAVRKNTARSDHHLLKSGDLFDVILVQMKGGTGKGPTAGDIARLKAVSKHYGAKEIVLFSWKRGSSAKFEALGRGDKWVESSPARLFG
jgi:hypothetical protein